LRDAYHEELDSISTDLVEMTRLVSGAIARATTALLDADIQMAESVIAGDEAIDAAYHALEEKAFQLLARQQPVATDLRMLVTSLRMVADIERAGDMALHVAKLARRRYPSSAVPSPLRPTILEMGQVAQLIMTKAGSVMTAPAPVTARSRMVAGRDPVRGVTSATSTELEKSRMADQSASSGTRSPFSTVTYETGCSVTG
jgi:phosphate transport system protein